MTDKTFPVTHTDEEWKKILTAEQYMIMRGHGTERPGSCALLYEKRHRLAKLQRAGRGGRRDDDRPELRHGADRGPLRHLRQPSRPCLQ
jgi:hypothetical protein